MKNISTLRGVAIGGAFCGLITLLASPAAHAQILINGSFESPAVGGGFSTVGVGSNALTGWVIEAGSVDVVSTSFWPAFDGLNSIDLDGASAGTISQTFSTVIGNQYSYSFEYSNNTGTSAVVSATATVVDSGANTLSTLNFSHQGASGASVAAMNYTLGSGFFTADTTSTTLRFTSTDSPGSDQGIALDAARVVVTGTGTAPEPASLGLLMAVFPVGVVALRRRRWHF